MSQRNGFSQHTWNLIHHSQIHADTFSGHSKAVVQNVPVVNVKEALTTAKFIVVSHKDMLYGLDGNFIRQTE